MRIALHQGFWIERRNVFSNVVLLFIFLYFVTTSADLLHIKISLYRCKINHLLSFFLLGFLMLSHRRWQLDRKLFFTFIATLCSMAISIFFSPYLPRSTGYVFVYLFTFTLYFFLPYNLVLMYGRDAIFRVYKAAFITTGVLGATQLFLSMIGVVAPFAHQTVLGKIARGQALTYEPSYFALYMIAYVMYCNAHYLFSSEKFIEVKNLIKLFLINLLLLVSTSTGAFYAYFILFAVCFGVQVIPWVRSCKRKLIKKLWLFSGIFFCLFAGIAVIARDIFLHSFWKFFRKGFMTHWSFAERWQGIVNAWNVFWEHPWFGVGIGGAGPLLYREYYFFGRSVELHQPSLEMFEPFDPTNVFTELLASMGVIGTLLFALFFFFYFKIFFRVAKMPEIPMKEKGVMYALLISLLVMLIVLQFNQNLFRSYVWVHLAFALGYASSLRNEYARS